MPVRPLKLDFPLAGLDQSAPYQSQPPFTSPGLSNVLPMDCGESRARGGVRPGMSYSSRLLVGSPIKHVSLLEAPMSGVTQIWADTFDYDDLDELKLAWDVPYGTPTLASITPALWTDSLPEPRNDSTLIAAVPNADETFQIGLAPKTEFHWNTTQTTEITVHACLKPSATTDALAKTWTVYFGCSPTGSRRPEKLDLKREGSNWHARFNHDSYTTLGATVPDEDTFDSTAKAWTFKVSIANGVTSLYVWKSGAWVATGITKTLTLSTDYDQRVAFGCQYPSSNASYEGYAGFFSVKIQYTEGNLSAVSDVVQMASGGKYAGTTSLGGSTIASDGGFIAGESMDGILFLADRSVNADVLDKQAYFLTDIVTGPPAEYVHRIYFDTAITAGELAKINTSDWVAIVYSTSDSDLKAIGNYRIVAADTAKITVHEPHGGTDYGRCRVRLARCPKLYNPAVDNRVFLWQADWVGDSLQNFKGAIPLGCPIIAKAFGRIVMAGAPDTPHVWHMSRVGDPWDWDTSQDDIQAALSGVAGDPGTAGKPITAVIPFTDDYLLIASKDDLWIIRGDPSAGGTMGAFDRHDGVLSKTAWCHGPNSTVWFLSRNGLCRLSVAEGVVHVTQPRAPRILTDIDTSTYEISMAYDRTLFSSGGVLVFVSLIGTPASSANYMIDAKTGAVFPISFGVTTHQPIATCIRESSTVGVSPIVLGCHDGLLRHFIKSAEKDVNSDGTTWTAITNYAILGPFLLGGNETFEGILHSFSAVFGRIDDAGTVAWKLYVDSDAQFAVYKAINSVSAFATGTWPAATSPNGTASSYITRPHARGTAFCLRIEGQALKTYALEGIVAEIEKLGTRRLW